MTRLLYPLLLILTLLASAACAAPSDGSLWDYTGNPLKRVENWGGSDYTTTLRYDNVYRLTEETKKNSGGTTQYTFGYTYDAVGNRLTRAKDGTTYTYSYDDNNKVTSASGGGLSASFSYDNNGNMTGVSGTMYGSKSLAYNDSNNLTSLTSAGATDLYYYTAGGQRYLARLAGANVHYTYTGARVLEERNDSDTLLSRYTTAGSSYFAPLLHEWFPSGSLSRFPNYDLTGTVRELVDASANVTDTYSLDAFGVKTTSDSGSTPNPYHYGGAWGYQTDRLGFLQLGHRFYWPELGRFLQQDPIGDGMNWYAYVGNNPVTGTDPAGLGNPVSDFVQGLGIMAGNAWHGVIDQFVPSDAAVNAYVASRQDSWIRSLNGNCLHPERIDAVHAISDGVVAPLMMGMAGPLGEAVDVLGEGGLLAKAAARYPNKVGKWELHHRRPIYMGGKLTRKVRLPGPYHQLITNAFRQKWAYGQGKPPEWLTLQIMEAVYALFPIHMFMEK